MIDKNNLLSLSYDEKIATLKETLEKTVKGSAIDEVFEVFVLLLATFDEERDFVQVLNFINDYKNINFNEKQRNKIYDYQITANLKLEEYNDLLKVLEEKNNLKNLSDKEYINIKFYYAIAYEALDEIDLSIQSLESIIDNISQSSLVNKYLKLSMLYLKKNDFDKSKEAYEYASMIDYNRRNDMFDLVESDLFYASKKYVEALNSYQTFFLKSVNKYKYLDRYILISIKLNLLDEAYNFYKTYENVPALKLSMSNKYIFFKAVEKLLDALKKKDELEEIKAQLEKIKPLYYLKEEKENEMIFLRISSGLGFPISEFDRNKNIVRKYLLLTLEKDEKAFYLEKDVSLLSYSYPDTKQMLEKKYQITDVQNNAIMDYFSFQELSSVEYFVNFKLEIEIRNTYILPLKDAYHDYGLLAISSERNISIFRVLRDVIFSKLNELSILKNSSNFKTSLNSLLSKKEIGYIKINNDYVEFSNDKSKELFVAKKDVVSFVEFKKYFSKDISIEDLTNDDSFEEEVLINDTKKLFIFTSYSNEQSRYLLIEDLTNTKLNLQKQEEYFYKSGLNFFNLNYLKKQIESSLSSYAIIGLNINIVKEKDSCLSRENILNSLASYLKQSSPQSEVYYLGENHFLLRSFSVDKRVLENTFIKIVNGIKQLYKVHVDLKEEEITGFCVKALKNKTYSEIIDIVEYGFKESLKSEGLLFLDNDEKKDYALFKTYESEITKKIKEGSINLAYKPIIDEEDNTIHYLYPIVSSKYPISEEVLERIIKRNSLEVKIDSLIIEKVIDELNKLKKDLRILIFVHKESILNINFIKKTSKIIKDNKLSNNIIICLEEYNNKDYDSSCKSLNNSLIKTAKRINTLDALLKIEDCNPIIISNKNDKFISAAEILFNGDKKELILSNSSKSGFLSINDSYRLYTFDDLLHF